MRVVRTRLAVNTVDFFNAISVLYGLLTEACTAESCPTMNAGPKYEYRWADGVKVKKPLECSAPAYVLYLMEWVEGQLDDEMVSPHDILFAGIHWLKCPLPLPQIFPQRPGQRFPRTFVDTVKTIFKRLFRVYAHIYHSHWDMMVTLGAEAHLNTCFKHFVFFTQQFQLIDAKEMAPLQELIDSNLGQLAAVGGKT